MRITRLGEWRDPCLVSGREIRKRKSDESAQWLNRCFNKQDRMKPGNIMSDTTWIVNGILWLQPEAEVSAITIHRLFRASSILFIAWKLGMLGGYRFIAL